MDIQEKTIDEVLVSELQEFSTNLHIPGYWEASYRDPETESVTIRKNYPPIEQIYQRILLAFQEGFNAGVKHGST